MPNRTINLAPYPYAAQQQEIERRRRMAQALQQQGMEPIEQPSMPGVPISPYQGLAKVLQSVLGGYQQRGLDKEQRQLDTARQTEQQKRALDMANAITQPAQGQPLNVGNAPLASMPVSQTLNGPANPTLTAGPPAAPPATTPTMGPPVDMTPPGGRVADLPPTETAERQRTTQVHMLAQALASPDPIQQQMAQAMMGDIYAQKREQRAALTAQGKTKEEQDFQRELNDKHAALARELAQMKPPAGDLAEWAEFQKLYPKPGDQTPENFFAFKQGQMRPTAPSTVTPHTVTTDQGVMQWNPTSGKFDIKIGNRPPSMGAEPLVPTTDQSGNTVYTPRSQAAGLKVPTSSQNKPPTPTERKMLGFYERVSNALDPIDQTEGDISKLSLAGQARLNWMPNFLQTPVGKRFTQAKNDFINASLRRESGAAISDAEYKRFDQIYFPQPGDDAPTLAQKKKARTVQLGSLQTESGKAFAEKYGGPEQAGGAGSVAPPAGNTGGFRIVP